MASGKTKQYNAREFERILIDNGFMYDKTGKGDHKKYRRGKELVVLPATNANKMLTRRLIKEHNLKF